MTSSVSSTQLRQLFELDQYYDHTTLNKLFDTVGTNLSRMAAQIDQRRIGQALFAYDSAISTDVRVGQPVYYDIAENKFKKSQLSVLVSSGRAYASASSEAWGILHQKCSADRGHILLSGLATVNLYESTGVSSPSGKFYLSTVAGLLSPTVDLSVVVPVLLATGSGEILFRPWFADTFPRYVPRLIDLETSPAGGTTVAGSRVTITSPNSNLSGWLPSNHATFGGEQPIGSLFGYNMAQDAVLSAAWPPIDPSLARVYYESGGADSQGARVMLGDDNDRLLINSAGIWWMDNASTQVPWSFVAEGSEAGTNPFPYSRRMTLEADFGIHGTEIPSGVSSLGSDVPWLQFYNAAQSQFSSVGNLTLNVDESQLTLNSTSTSAIALKGMTDGKFVAGPVLSGVKSSSPSLQITGGLLQSGYRSGLLDLSVTASKDFDLMPLETQLFGATTEAYAETMALGLPPQINSSFVSSFHIPHTVQPGALMRFVVWLVGQTTYNLPAGLLAKVRRFTKPTVGEVAVPAESPITLNYTVGEALSAGSYIELTTDTFEVSGGESIYLRLERSGATDGNSAEVHVLKHYGKFEAS